MCSGGLSQTVPGSIPGVIRLSQDKGEYISNRKDRVGDFRIDARYVVVFLVCIAGLLFYFS
jgi:hypothetical protein